MAKPILIIKLPLTECELSLEKEALEKEYHIIILKLNCDGKPSFEILKPEINISDLEKEIENIIYSQSPIPDVNIDDIIKGSGSVPPESKWQEMVRNMQERHGNK